MTPLEKKHQDLKLTKMVAGLHLPFSHINEPLFLEYSHGLKESYNPPDRHEFSKNHLTGLAQLIHEKIAKATEEAEFVSMSTDDWTSSVTEHYITVLIHFILHGMLKTACIGVGELLSANALGHKLRIEEFFAPYPGLQQKLVAFVSDNTNLMPATARLLNIPFYGCFPHGVNLVVQTGLNSSQAFASTLVKIREVRRVIKDSQPATNVFKAAQKKLQSTRRPRKLLKDMPVRWGSTFYMGARYIDDEAVVKYVATKMKLKIAMPSDTEIEELRRVLAVLKLLTTLALL